MSIKTFRAKSLQEAIALVRRELGPDASLLHTREIGRGLWGRLRTKDRIEVAASADVQAPSRLAPTSDEPLQPTPPPTPPLAPRLAEAAERAAIACNSDYQHTSPMQSGLDQSACDAHSVQG